MFERDEDEDEAHLEPDLHGPGSVPTEPKLTHNHGRIVEAIETCEAQNSQNQKEIAWLLVEELGPPQADTTNDGSYGAMQAISADLAERGIDNYSVDLLRKLRKFGATFPKDVEVASLGWSTQLAVPRCWGWC
jgi:hypothetical protein